MAVNDGGTRGAPAYSGPREPSPGPSRLPAHPCKDGGMMILIAGPYRSGTGDDPSRMPANVRAMEAYALPLFRAGHIPVVGEWFALPLVALAGSRQVGDAPFNEIFHPIAERLLARCDAVLPVGGPSQGADQMLQVAREQGLRVFTRLHEIPGCAEDADPA